MDITIEDGVDGGIIEDTYIRSDAPTSNFGTATAVLVSIGTSTREVLTYVDLSSLVGVTPLNGKFLCKTTNFGATVATFKTYKLLKRFVELEATWNIYETGSNWETAGAQGATDKAATEDGSFTANRTAGVVVDVDITVPTLTEWLTTNNGLLLESQDNIWGYGSAEHLTTPVQFYMEYTEGGGGFPFFFGAGHY